MKKASKFFSEEERKIIEDAVTQAESKTSGEIVPVIAKVSGRYDRAEDIFGLITAVAALSIIWIFFADLVTGLTWGAGDANSLGLIHIILIVVAGFIVGAMLATMIPSLRLPFIGKGEMKNEVERRAAEAFWKFRLRKTEGATGILIYISLYERMVRIVGDDAITEKLKKEDWDSVRNLIIKGMKEDRAAEGFRDAILECGELLSEHFPIQPGDKNELSNELKIID